MEHGGSLKTSDSPISNDAILRVFRNSGSWFYDSMCVNPGAHRIQKIRPNPLLQIEKPALKCAQRVNNDEIRKITDRNLTDKANDQQHFPKIQRLLKNDVTTMLDCVLAVVKTNLVNYVRFGCNLALDFH
ncbi:unnamed protein product [Orchesella dallaii]|uniref:Uncharacterized protein n=1 Tax=Orchesella dallaii TaxID=48710 RepID=A0ABP1R3J4_9HEXA